MKRNIFIVITVLLCFILQSTVFRWLAFGGIAPNLLVIITATFGFMCGQKCGLWVGFFSGLLYDIFSEMFYAFMHLFLCILALQTDISSRSSLKRISSCRSF